MFAPGGAVEELISEVLLVAVQVAEDVGIAFRVLEVGGLHFLEVAFVAGVVAAADGIEGHPLVQFQVAAHIVPHTRIKLYPMQRSPDPKPAEDPRRPKPSPTSSRAEPKELVLRFDINKLLSLFNEMETNSGTVGRKGIRKIMEAIGLYSHEHLLKDDSYSFDAFLSLLGEIEVPNEPSVYVLSFVKILAGYRDRLPEGEGGLAQAREVQEKIQTIIQGELQRQKQRIKGEHSKIYEEMQASQEKQFAVFEDEWQHYLKEFREETARRMQQTRYARNSQLAQEETKYIAKSRRHSVLTSPRINELLDRKRWLIKDKRYDNAIEVSQQISREKARLSECRQQATGEVLTKKLEKLASKTNQYLGAIEQNLEVNLNRLISKKKEGENIMKLRMKNLREEAHRKLNEHYRNQIHRLRSSFYLAANS